MANLDIALTNYNAGTARYNFAKNASGDVAFDATQAYPVMTAVSCDGGAYWADVGLGSRLGQLRNLTLGTPSQAENMALEAMLQLEQLNLIRRGASTASASRDLTPGGGNRLLLDVGWTTPGGQIGQRTVTV